LLTIAAINPFTAARFSALTFSSYRDALESRDAAIGLTGVGATSSGDPVGLALARRRDQAPAELVSLYVVPDFRRRGLGARLLQQLQWELAAAGSDRLEARYAADAPGTAAFDGVLRRCQWPAGRDLLHVFTLDGQIMSAPWFGTAVLTPSYAIAPWATVTPEEREGLGRPSPDTEWIPAELRPTRYDSNLDAVTSLVLRLDGVVVGWSLTQLLDPVTVHYANLFVRPSCNRVGRTFAALALLAEAVRRQEAARGAASRGRFEVAGTNTGFLRFIDRHFGPYLLSRATLRRAMTVLPGRASQ
jgi:GNAT superfamily N-acetyltransferase